MQYLPEFLTIAGVHMLAVMSPGADFAMITRNSLAYSRRTGIYSALGLALGLLVHIAYSLIGIGLIISQSIILFSFIKYLGAAYLIYIGYKSLRAKPHTAEIQSTEKKNDITPLAAIRTGFLTNILNPKVTLFFLALFTQVIHQSTPLGIKFLYAAEMFTATFLWFAFVATLFSHHLIKQKVTKVQHYIEKGIGVVLIGLGVKVAIDTTK